jgi:hypothetical protein
MPEYMLRTLQLYCTDNKVHGRLLWVYCSESEANESVGGFEMRRNEWLICKMRQGAMQRVRRCAYIEVGVWSCGLLVRAFVRDCGEERETSIMVVCLGKKSCDSAGELAAAGRRRASLDGEARSSVGAAVRGGGLLRDPPDW